MAKQLIQVDGVTIKTPPDDIGIESYNLTKSGRVVSGLMMLDIIARKRKFTFSYPILSSTQMQVILDRIDGGLNFMTLSYVDANVTKTATVYAGAIKKRKARSGNIWYYKDVSFDLIER